MAVGTFDAVWVTNEPTPSFPPLIVEAHPTSTNGGTLGMSTDGSLTVTITNGFNPHLTLYAWDGVSENPDTEMEFLSGGTLISKGFIASQLAVIAVGPQGSAGPLGILTYQGLILTGGGVVSVGGRTAIDAQGECLYA